MINHTDPIRSARLLEPRWAADLALWELALGFELDDEERERALDGYFGTVDWEGPVARS